MSSYKINGVEIFSAGTWNGDKYTVDDLQEMLSAFEENKEAVRPYLKLGHDKDQKLLQKDGYPAAGWIDRLYIKGEKLLADFSDVPEKIYELIQKKAYRKVSSEVYWNIKINNKLYKKMLGAVALLGANTPGVMNLSDILAMYKLAVGEQEPRIYDLENVFKEINIKPNGDKKMELEQVKKEFTEKLQTQETQLSKSKEEADALKKEVEALKEFKAKAEEQRKEYEAQKLALEQEAQKAKNEKFISDLEKEFRVSPAMKPYVMELLGETKKEYTIEDKKLTKEDLIKEFLKLYSSALEVNLDENSSHDYDKKTEGDEDKMHKAAKEYAEKHNVSYSVAVKELMKKK